MGGAPIGPPENDSDALVGDGAARFTPASMLCLGITDLAEAPKLGLETETTTFEGAASTAGVFAPWKTGLKGCARTVLDVDVSPLTPP